MSVAHPVSPEMGGSLPSGDCEAPQDREQAVYRPWYALHVRSNHEFRVRDALNGQAVTNFCPSYEVRRGKETFERPLFPGYLFARFDVRHRLPILKISGLLSILGDHSGPIEVPETQVTAIRQLIAAEPDIRPHPPVTHGTKVRVRYGALMGREGIVEYIRGERVKVIFNEPLLGGATAAQIDRDSIEPIP